MNATRDRPPIDVVVNRTPKVPQVALLLRLRLARCALLRLIFPSKGTISFAFCLCSRNMGSKTCGNEIALYNHWIFVCMGISSYYPYSTLIGVGTEV